MAEQTQKKQVLKIVRIEDNEVVKEIDVTGSSSARIEKLMRGLLFQMNTDEYFVDDSEAYADE
jgi:hypothetical protein